MAAFPEEGHSCSLTQPTGRPSGRNLLSTWLGVAGYLFVVLVGKETSSLWRRGDPVPFLPGKPGDSRLSFSAESELYGDRQMDTGTEQASVRKGLISVVTASSE